MGSSTHAPGVMSAKWRRPDFQAIGQRALRFTPAEIAQLHRGLQNRYSASDAGKLLLAQR